MTADLLSSVSGVILSLLFSYLPGLSAWYGEQSGDKKRIIMLGMLALVAAGMYALDCGGIMVKFAPDLAGMCGEDGRVQVVRAFVTAAIANQTAFALSPQK